MATLRVTVPKNMSDVRYVTFKFYIQSVYHHNLLQLHFLIIMQFNIPRRSSLLGHLHTLLQVMVSKVISANIL